MANSKYDVVVAGGALGGLICAAILSKRGYKVALVDEINQPGSRAGAIESSEHKGYWINMSRRDGHGIIDGAIHGGNTARAFELAGIKPDYEGQSPSWRIHNPVLGTVVESFIGVSMGEMTSPDPLKDYRELALVSGVPADRVNDVAAAVNTALTRLAAMGEEQAWLLIEETFGGWLKRNVEDHHARQVILQMLETQPSSPAEQTSVGRFIFHLKGGAYQKNAVGYPKYPGVGGLQGAMSLFADAIKSNGGEIWLGWKPAEILTERRRVTGLVAINETSFVKTFEARVVITDLPCWDLPTLLDPELLPHDFVTMAENIKSYTVSCAGWWAGLKRPPTLRSTGQKEDVYKWAWNRMIRGEAGERKVYSGIWGFMGGSRGMAPSIAPADKHLMVVWRPSFGEFRYRNFAEAKSYIDANLDYIRKFYLDLDDCIEWSDYQFQTHGAWPGWHLKPIRRHPVKISTITGLYLASGTAEGKGEWSDAEPEAALAVVQLVEEDCGMPISHRS